MSGLVRLHAALDQFFFNMATSSLLLNERIPECFCETIIEEGVLRYLPETEVKSFNDDMIYYLGIGLDDFDEDYMRDVFSRYEYQALNGFASCLFRLKARLQEHLLDEKLEC